MSETFHKVIWIDHRCARLYDFTRDALQEIAAISAPDNPGHLHHHAGTPGPGHMAPDNHYFKRVGDALEGAGAILIAGPGDAKAQFSQFVRDRMPHIAKHIVGIEPCERLSDGELHAFSKRFFARADRMTRPR